MNKASAEDISSYKLSRRGKKLGACEDQRLFAMLPKEISDHTWADILEREEIDLMLMDLREEIYELAFQTCYESYLERQTVYFTSYCTAQALLQLFEWEFYRHDPGEDPTANPEVYIPKRAESWIPDKIPDPSLKDVYASQELEVVEGDTCEPSSLLSSSPSSDSLDYPVVKPIPKKYWFPGKVCIDLPDESVATESTLKKRLYPDLDMSRIAQTESSPYISDSPRLSDFQNEKIEKIIDYTEATDLAESDALFDGSCVPSSATDYTKAGLKSVGSMSLCGAGDSTFTESPPSRSSPKILRRSKSSFSKSRLVPVKAQSLARLSVISDCRLRNFRLNYKVSKTTEEPVP